MRLALLALLCSLVSWTAFAADAPEKPGSLGWAIAHYEVKPEDRPYLEKIEKYLSGITTVNADFVQVEPNGNISSGKFYMQRPGRMRMEYNPPNPVLLVTNGNALVYYDKSLQQVTNIPLSSTLVGFLTRPQIRFDSSVKIVDFTRKPGSLRLTLVQTARPKDGLLTLEFQDDPLKIRNMVVTDSAGQITTVSLNNAQFDVPVDQKLFVFRDPRKKYPNVPD
jgi:outer membrane lipoprotein-sorting protein